MKLLVLGGTRFLGRHVVETALARGDDVTIFTRGRATVAWRHERSEHQEHASTEPRRRDPVTALTGDRDPRIAPGLGALEQGTWDAVIDCSGYVPRRGSRRTSSRLARVALRVRLDAVGVREDRSPGHG